MNICRLYSERHLGFIFSSKQRGREEGIGLKSRHKVRLNGW